MKTKIQIKTLSGSLLFELEKENNSIKDTLIEAVKINTDLRGADLQGAALRGACLQGADLQGACLQGADLRGACLRGACLRGADLQGAYLQGVKIKKAAVFTGLYSYIVIPYITETDEVMIKMGCHDRSLLEWEENFWNNPLEFPNNGDINSKERLLAYETAKKWLELNK